MLNILNNEDITSLDRQIEQLVEFKPIPEHEVKLLCEKVRIRLINNKNHIFCYKMKMKAQ